MAAWVVNDHDQCVWIWSPGSLVRGPVGMINGPILLVRCPAEGFYYTIAQGREDAGIFTKIADPLAMFALGAAVGVLEGVVSIAFGLGDTLTGGYFELLPDQWATLAFFPEQECLATRDTGVVMGFEDHCGRHLDSFGKPQPTTEPLPTATPGPLPPEKLRPIPNEQG